MLIIYSADFNVCKTVLTKIHKKNVHSLVAFKMKNNIVRYMYTRKKILKLNETLLQGIYYFA